MGYVSIEEIVKNDIEMKERVEFSVETKIIKSVPNITINHVLT